TRGSMMGVGVARYDTAGTPVVPPAPLPAYCELRTSRHGEAERCAGTKENVSKALDPEEKSQIRGCFTGFKYLALNIKNNLDPIGVAVVGPFADAGSKDYTDPPEGISAAERSE